ncbi:MAG: hypothetical protein L6R38_000080 [Xanthoria sp. 2 TBL-2021]|nr:MAG: hypothetical protein L6R38_000080 [Xanthoria sp. 2 TBL-2021]
MEHIQGSTPQESVYRTAGFAESSTRLNEEGIRNASPGAASRTRSPRIKGRLSTRGQQVKDEMKKKALEAQAYLSRGYDSDSSDDDDDDDLVRTVAPSFTKNTLPLKQLMPTIVEESESFSVEKQFTFSVTIRSNSVHTRTNVQSSRLPEIFDQAKLEVRIAEIDELLDNEAAVQICYRERLWKIREAFEDLKAHWSQKDIPELMNTLKYDLEVRVACLAQANVKQFTHLLLHGNVSEDMKVKLRRYLAYSETMTNPRLDDNTNLVLDYLEAAAASIESGLANNPPETAAAIAAVKHSRLKRDVAELEDFLQDILLLRYDRNQYPPRLNVKNMKPLGQYIRWKSTRDEEVAASLAKKLGLHPIELDYVMQDRLDSLLEHSPVDPWYIQARLCDLDNIWNWVTEYNRLAHHRRWTKLAGQFCDDRAQFDLIFPDELRYIDPERGIFRSNTKARVHFGMSTLRSHYFAKLKSPNDYKLSAHAKSMDKRFIRGEQERLRERKGQQGQRRALSSNGSSSQTEEDRPSFKPRALARLRRWAREGKDSLKTRSKNTSPKENQ